MDRALTLDDLVELVDSPLEGVSLPLDLVVEVSDDLVLLLSHGLLGVELRVHLAAVLLLKQRYLIRVSSFKLVYFIVMISLELLYLRMVLFLKRVYFIVMFFFE